MDRTQIEQILKRFGEAAVSAKRHIPLGLLGGGALVLSEDFRKETDDIDFVILREVNCSLRHRRSLKEPWDSGFLQERSGNVGKEMVLQGVSLPQL